jgi:hypothetical protein
MGGLERELAPGLSLAVTGIYRRNRDFIDDVLIAPPSAFFQRTVPDPGPDGIPGTGDETSALLRTYRQLTDPLLNRYVITNPDDAFREYKAVEVMAYKRLTGRWSLQGSYVFSTIRGNIDNTNNFGNGNDYDDPNTDARLQPFRTGELTHDNRHLAKALAIYRAPWQVIASGAFFYTTGDTFTRTVRVALPQGLRELFAEERGSQRYDDQPRLDLKVEKQFQVTETGRLGLTVEAFNVLNDAAVTERTTRSGGVYFVPRALVEPRRFRLGAVYRF